MQKINNIQFRGVSINKPISERLFLYKNLRPEREFYDLCSSANKNNWNVRNKILSSKVLNKSNKSLDKIDEQLKEVNKLFAKLDSDANAKSFISKLPIGSLNNISIKTLNDILQNISTLKLKIFASNASVILAETKEESVIKTLNEELENPFYETKMQKYWRNSEKSGGYRKPESLVLMALKKLCNYVNILRYKYSSRNVVEKPNNVM